MNETHNKPCALILIGVAMGVVLDRYCGIPFSIAWLSTLVLVTVYLGSGFVRFVRSLFGRKQSQSKENTSTYVSSSILLLAWVAAGASWHHLHYHLFHRDDLGLFAQEESSPVALRGIVSSNPISIPPPTKSLMDLPVGQQVVTRMTIEVSEIRNGSEWQQVHGKAILNVRGENLCLEAGDGVELSGYLSSPKSGRSPGDFDSREYFRGQRINATVFVGRPENIRRMNRGSFRWQPLRILGGLTRRCEEIIDRNFSPESAKLIRAMLLGQRHCVPKKIQHQFMVSGTMHLLAISGLHVGILASGWLVLIRIGVLPRTTGYLLTIVFVVLYCLLTGLRPPVFRASVLLVLFCVAKIMGRNPVSVNSLCLAGLTVVLLNPVALFQPGPQLSFIAVAVLIMISEQVAMGRKSNDPLVLFFRRKRTKVERIRDRILLDVRLLAMGSLGIWIATLPLVSEHFHVVAPVGIVANVLLMIPITILLNFAFLTMLFGSIGLGGLFSSTAEAFLELTTNLIQFASQLPCGHWWSFGVGAFWLCVFYAIFTFFFLNARFRISFQWQIALSIFWLAAALLVSFPREHRKSLQITFIDVGHGTSVLIEYPNGNCALYDAGCLHSSSLANERISAILWHKRIARLNAIIVSHADLDHYNSIPDLLERFPVDHLLVSPQMDSVRRGLSLRELRRRIHSKTIECRLVDANSQVVLDPQCATEILHPPPGFLGQSDNANSLVVRIEFEGKSVLLTGDLEGNGLAMLTESQPRKVDVMLAPHHGSHTTDHARLLEWASPSFVVVSSGRRVLDEKVSNVYRAKDTKIYETAKLGTIGFEIRKEGVFVTPYLEHTRLHD